MKPSKHAALTIIPERGYSLKSNPTNPIQNKIDSTLTTIANGNDSVGSCERALMPQPIKAPMPTADRIRTILAFIECEQFYELSNTIFIISGMFLANVHPLMPVHQNRLSALSV